jgi:phage baseplate assembly protein W
MRQVRTYVDLDPSFEANPSTGDLITRKDERAIKFSIKNLVMTNFYERPFRSFIGSHVSNLMFENAGANFRQILKRSIEDTITNFEPRVELLEVYVSEDEDVNKVDVAITFRVVNTERPIKFDLTLKRLR